MASVTGFGGVFIRAKDPDALYAWYEQHLGLIRGEGFFTFAPPAQHPHIVFSFFERDDGYFPQTQPVMINLQVDDLDAILERLAAHGVAVDPKREAYEFGKFGWVTDPEGNRVELWQPLKT